MITRNNYEEYFLDYFDGNLTEVQKKDLFSFLNENVDLKAEFERFSPVELPKEKIFFDKEKLKRNTITMYNYKTWFIAYLENDLIDEERGEVEKFIGLHPLLKNELELFRQAKVLPDFAIRFENNSELKRIGKVIVLNAWVYRSAAIAASIALFFVFIYVFNKDKGTQQVASSGKKNEATVPVKSNEVKVQQLVAVEPVKQKSVRPVKHAVEVRKDYPSVKNNPIELPVNNSQEESPALANNASQAPVIINEMPSAAGNAEPQKNQYKVFSDEIGRAHV